VRASSRDFAYVYIGDVLIHSDIWQERLQHIAGALTALQHAGLTAKPTKGQWGRLHLYYLGHIVGCGKVAVLIHIIEAMASFKRPSMKKELRNFLGSIDSIDALC